VRIKQKVAGVGDRQLAVARLLVCERAVARGAVASEPKRRESRARGRGHHDDDVVMVARRGRGRDRFEADDAWLDR